MKKLALVSLLVGVIGGFVLGQGNYKPLYRPYTLKEAKDIYQGQAMEHIAQAFKYSSFAASLNCPCYDVEISSVPEGMKVTIDTDRCPEVK